MADSIWDLGMSTSVSEKDKDSAVEGVTHTLGVIGEGALHALPDVLGFVGDLGVDAVNVLKNAYRRRTGSDLPPEALHLPGLGPVSEAVNKSFEAAEEKYTGGKTPRPRNKGEEYANVVSRGIAGGLLGGPEFAGKAAIGGAAAGAAAQSVWDLTGNEYAAYGAGLVAGGAPFVRGGKSPVRSGMKHPEFAMLADEVIPALEGGGTFENPKVNAKSGAMGPMQVTPETARDPGYGIRPWDGKTQEDLARVGREKFAALLHKYDGDTSKALAGYNWGEGNVDKAVKKYGDNWLAHTPKETFDYVNNGMQRAYGGNPLRAGSTGGDVPPMQPEDLAMARGEELGPESPKEPIARDPGEVIDLGQYKQERTDAQSLSDVNRALDEADAIHDAISERDWEIVPDLEDLQASRDSWAKYLEKLNMDRVNRDPVDLEHVQELVNAIDDAMARIRDGVVEKPRLDPFATEGADKFLGQEPKDVTPANENPTLRENISAYIKDSLENSDFGRDSRALDDIESQAESLLQELKDKKISFDEYDARVESLNAARAAIIDRFKKNHQAYDASTEKPDVKSSVNITGKGPPKGPTEPPFGGGGEPPRGKEPPFGGGGDEPPREPPAEGEDKYAGSINLNRMVISDAAKENIKLMAAPMNMDIETFRDTQGKAHKLIQDHGVEGVLNINQVSPEDFGAYATAVRGIHAAAQEHMIKLNEEFLNPETNSEVAHLRWSHAKEILAAAFERNQEIAKGLGRGLSALRIEVGGLEGKLGEKVSDLMKVRATDEEIARMIQENPELVGKIARDSERPGATEYIFTTWYAMLLSSLKTFAKNLLSNTGMISWDTMVVHPLAAAFGKVHGGDKVTFHEAGARTIGAMHGLIDGIKNAPEAYRRGTPSDFVERTQSYWRPQNKGIGRVVSAPGRLLSAQDQMFLDAAQNAEYYGLAHRQAFKEDLVPGTPEYNNRVRELLETPTKSMEKAAIKYGQMMRFQDPMEFKGLEYATRSTKKDPLAIKVMKGFLRVLFPFPRNSDRMFFAAMRNSPLGVLEPQNLRDFRAGGAKRDIALARVFAGTVMTGVLYAWAANGGITGAGPSDPAKNAQWRRNHQPYSINFPGGVHVSYRGVADPFSIMLASIATGLEQAKEKGDSLEQKIFRSATQLTGVMLDSTWAMGASQFFDALDDRSGKTMEHWLGRMASSFTTPAIVRNVAQEYIDPTVRNTKEHPFTDELKASAPFLSKDLPAKHDVYGDVIKRENPGKMNFINPSRVQIDKGEKLSKDIDKFTGDKALITKAPSKINGVKLTAEQQERYQELSGKYLKQMLSEDPGWRYLPSEQRQKRVKEILSNARTRAKAEMGLGTSHPGDIWSL